MELTGAPPSAPTDKSILSLPDSNLSYSVYPFCIQIVYSLFPFWLSVGITDLRYSMVKNFCCSLLDITAILK